MWSSEFVIGLSQLNKDTLESINMIAAYSLFLKKRSFNFLIKSLCKLCIINELTLECIIINILRKIKWAHELLTVTELLKLSFKKIINFSDSLNVWRLWSWKSTNFKEKVESVTEVFKIWTLKNVFNDEELIFKKFNELFIAQWTHTYDAFHSFMKLIIYYSRSFKKRFLNENKED